MSTCNYAPFLAGAPAACAMAMALKHADLMPRDVSDALGNTSLSGVRPLPAAQPDRGATGSPTTALPGLAGWSPFALSTSQAPVGLIKSSGQHSRPPARMWQDVVPRWSRCGSPDMRWGLLTAVNGFAGQMERFGDMMADMVSVMRYGPYRREPPGSRASVWYLRLYVYCMLPAQRWENPGISLSKESYCHHL